MEQLVSYHGDPLVKQKYVDRFARHRLADAVIQGTGYDGCRGCFVGCTLQSYDHERFPEELGGNVCDFDAARSAAYIAERDLLLKLLREMS